MEYKKIFLAELDCYLKQYNFMIDDREIISSKMSKMIDEDPVFIYHFNTEYWAKFIKEVINNENIK